MLSTCSIRNNNYHESSADRQDQKTILMLSTNPPEKLGRMERSIFLEVSICCMYHAIIM